jgi:hydroxymethylbilane synthase
MTHAPGKDIIRIGTRGSRLARWQANWVAERLRGLHPELTVELVEIKTQGDRDQNSPLTTIGGVGLFTKEIQRSVQSGSVDVAVHSLKDVPTQGPTDLILAAVPVRDEVSDALVAPKHIALENLPAGARVGTGSPRRRAQVLFLRPDLELVSLRGNVETRLNRTLDGGLDAVVLAWAGLRRLGLERHVTQRLGPPGFLPAVGQGALAIECRRDDLPVLTLIKPLDDSTARRSVQAERTVMAALEGGCTLPLAAWARDVNEDEAKPDRLVLALDAAVYDPDGRDRVLVTLHGPLADPEDLGRRAAQALRDQGAEALLNRMAR